MVSRTSSNTREVVRGGIQSERCPRRHPIRTLSVTASNQNDVCSSRYCHENDRVQEKMLSGTASNDREVVRDGIQSERCPSRHPIRMMSAVAAEEVIMKMTESEKDVVRDGIQ